VAPGKKHFSGVRVDGANVSKAPQPQSSGIGVNPQSRPRSKCGSGGLKI